MNLRGNFDGAYFLMSLATPRDDSDLTVLASRFGSGRHHLV